MNILGVAGSYEELAGVLKTERRRRGISQTKFEQSVEWDYEYLWKLETLRKFPAGKLADWLRGLNVKLVVVRMEDANHAFNQKDMPSCPEAYDNFRKKIGAKGGRARARNLTKRQIREIGRLGAEKRWGRRSGETRRAISRRGGPAAEGATSPPGLTAV
jgi:hypothetical protein